MEEVVEQVIQQSGLKYNVYKSATCRTCGPSTSFVIADAGIGVNVRVKSGSISVTRYHCTGGLSGNSFSTKSSNVLGKFLNFLKDVNSTEAVE
jgi:hypothetical protein